ncbi:MAG: monovalent cation/H(+) antiporter subunit G [bacterium]|nr:monovalent cation/H(+) antiporter subunit G [bacterium]
MIYVRIALQILAAVFIIAGVFFFIAATVGIIRMPDPYNRAHAAGKGDSPGFLLSLTGVWLYWLTINPAESFKILLIILFMLFANPIAVHAILRFCYRTGVPWVKETTVHLLKDQREEKD